MVARIAVKPTVETQYEVVLDELHAQLARRHMTQIELGRRAGIRQATISRRMTGEIAFTLPELFDICSVLNLTVTELLQAAERNKPRPADPVTRGYPPANVRPLPVRLAA